MWTNNKLLLIFTLLCAYPLFVRAIDYRSFKKEWKFQGPTLFQYGQAIASEDNSFLYAVCDDEKLPAEMNCNVTIWTPSHQWIDHRSPKHTCSIKLIASESHEVAAVVSVERFSKDRAIVVWWERRPDSQYEIHNVKVSILHLNKCSITHLTFPVDVEGHVFLSNVVTYPDGFDVIVSNKTLCGTPICRISHDIEGNRIGHPSPFITNFASAYIQPVNPISSAKGFYVSGPDVKSWKFRAMHVSPDGVATNLITASVSDPRQVQRATSNAHEMFGICLMGYEKIHCAQFDDKAGVKMNATVSNIGRVHWMAVHNLAEGGLLLLTGQCKNYKCRSFRLTKVQGGKEEEPIQVPGLQLRCSFDPFVPHNFVVDTLDSGNELCFYFACSYVHGAHETDAKSSLKFTVKCVPKV